MLSTPFQSESVYIKTFCEPTLPDKITLQLLILKALSKFGGIHASAIPVEILALQNDPDNEHTTAYLKCPKDDEKIVMGALGGASHDDYTLQIVDSSPFLPKISTTTYC